MPMSGTLIAIYKSEIFDIGNSRKEFPDPPPPPIEMKKEIMHGSRCIPQWRLVTGIGISRGFTLPELEIRFRAAEPRPNEARTRGK